MTRDDLKHARQQWYAAYFAGDVEHLARVQADNFSVTTDRGVQSKQSQIAAISSAKVNGSWFPEGGEIHDAELTFEETGGSTTLTGRGYTVAGQRKGPAMAFSETWEWDGIAWWVVNLSYSVVGDQG